MNVRELKDKCKQELESIYEEREAQQITDRLIEEYLQLNRVEAVLNAQKKVASEIEERVKIALAHLKKGEPIDYILHKTTFFGREFIVDSRVLIPRPETEELCQLILEREDDKKLSILDIGTGSGCIPITLKLEGEYRSVEACEVSEEALENAYENAQNLGADIKLFQMDILKEKPDKKYNIIVSNPPYVLKEELNTLDKKVVEFEPLVALAPEGEALQFYKRILEILPGIIKKGGRVYFEIHEDKGDEMEKLMKDFKLEKVEVIEDMYGRDRIACGVYHP